MSVIKETINYFKEKATKYDLVEEQTYWILSDKLLWKSLSNILGKLPSDFSFLDAGGGTGRWSLKVLESYPKANGYTFDLSEDMLNECKQKRNKYSFHDRWEIYQGDLHNIEQIPNESLDVAFNFHNVLGFVENPEKVIGQIASKVKKDGLVISFVPNKYHSIFFNIAVGNIEEAVNAAKGKGRFTTEMPYIHLFTPGSIEEIYKKNSLEKVEMVGFPSFIYPGYQETQLEGNTQRLLDTLSKQEYFDAIYELEKKFLCEELVSRGNNIFIVGKK